MPKRPNADARFIFVHSLIQAATMTPWPSAPTHLVPAATLPKLTQLLQLQIAQAVPPFMHFIDPIGAPLQLPSAEGLFGVLPVALSVLGEVAGVVEPDPEEGEEVAAAEFQATMTAAPSAP